MSNYCPNCGNKLDEGELFCPKCGAKVVKENNTPRKTIAVEESDTPKKTIVVGADETNDEVKNKQNNNVNTKNSGSNILICIVGIVVVLIVLFGIMSLFTGGDSTVNVNGVTFNIPDGYVESPDKTNQFIRGFETKNPTEYYEAKVYSKGDDIIILQVTDSSNPSLNGIGGKSVTFNGHKGKLTINHVTPMFYYWDNGKFIGVGASHADFEEIIT